MQSTENVAEFQRLLGATDERASLSARLRPLLPLIQSRINAGASYTAMLDDLVQAGFPIKRRVLERSLYRWRKAQRINAPSLATQAQHAVMPTPSTPGTKPPEDAIQGRPRRIETPGDLRTIRTMDIDLDALRREGQAKRKAHRATNQTPQSGNTNKE